MLLNTLKSTIRSQRRNKTNLVINLLGLTIGIASVMMISAYVLSELKIGSEFKDAGNIYNVEMEITQGQAPVTPFPLGRYLKDNMAAVEDASIIKSFTASRLDFKIKQDDKEYLIKNLLSADTSFFKIFPYSTIAGDPVEALENPNNIVLTQSEVKRIFGDKDPMGKALMFEGNLLYTVGAVIEDIPLGHLNYFQSVINIESPAVKPFLSRKNWSSFSYTCLLKISSATDVNEIEEYIESIYKEKNPGFVTKFKPEVKLVAYNDLYFSKGQVGNFKIGNFKFVMAFIVVAFIILVIAIINFINLTNAQGLSRAKEIGIRKVNGSSRSGLINGFVIESLLLIIGAFAITTVLIFIVREVFEINELKPVFQVLRSPVFLVISLFSTVIVGTVSGLFPGFHLTGINLINVLKGEKISMSGGNLSKMGLISSQFVISIVLIVSVLTINKQMNYVLHKDIGFKANNLVYFRVPKTKPDLLRDKITRHTAVEELTFTDGIIENLSGRYSRGLKTGDELIDVQYARVDGDTHFLSTMGIELIAGRNFHKNEDAYVINETAARLWNINDIDNNILLENKNVVGIVKDFNILSLHSEMEPMVIANNNGFFCVAKISSSNPTEITSAINHIKSSWEEVEGGLPPDISFMDESINNMYKKEAHFQMVLNIFAALAVFISVIGLFGISLYLITARTKEIGVRKVNGASISEVIGMLNRSFITWVLISFILAVPLSYFVMNKWLENFAYKTTISWWIFPIAGASVLAIALVTVSIHSWKAANMNPVKALRYE
jgi:putative ABC transport system permease protein